MDPFETVKAYFNALDSVDIDQVSQFLSDDYQMIDFTAQPMDKAAMLELMCLLWVALPNLKYSLSNIRMDNDVDAVGSQGATDRDAEAATAASHQRTPRLTSCRSSLHAGCAVNATMRRPLRIG